MNGKKAVDRRFRLRYDDEILSEDGEEELKINAHYDEEEKV